MKGLLMMLLVLTSAGCSLGPDYVRPEVEVPASWRNVMGDGTTLIDTAWWQQFNDTELNQLVDQAVHANRDLQLAAARVDQYLGQLETSRSQLFPQAGYGLNVTRQDNSATALAPVDPPAFTNYQASLSVGWELDLWGRIRRNNEAALAQISSSEEARRGILVSLVANVASGYLTLRGLDRQLEIARSTERSYAETMRIFRLRHQYGAISRIELSQVESQHALAAQAVPRLEAQIAVQENLLSILIGQNPGPIPRGTSLEDLLPPRLPDELPLTLLERRPDIRQAEHDLVAANARIGAAKALYFPTISLSGLLGRQDSDLAEMFRNGHDFWSLGGNLAGPLVTFGAISGQVKQAESIAVQTLIRYEQVIQNAFRDVEDALIESLKSEEQQRAQDRQVQALSDYARLSRLKFENGQVGYLQVLDAERALFSAQLAQVQTRTVWLASAINVYRALAGGWVDLVDPL